MAHKLETNLYNVNYNPCYRFNKTKRISTFILSLNTKIWMNYQLSEMERT